jgi:hypothetical protein
MAKTSKTATAATKTTGFSVIQKTWTAAMSHDLCKALLLADEEKQVNEIINSNSFLSNPANWIPIARNENNMAIVNNQSSSSAKALAEMFTNMVDAILMRLCRETGIDPRSPEAPQSLAEALELFYGWEGGRMANGFKNMHAATTFAEKNMVLAWTGYTPHEPTLTFCDSGEGQHPQDFDTTFMSLGEGGGKRHVPFVQGQYNMGSSGVLGFCGDFGYKLVVSRKHTLDGKWGWSLVRRRPGADRIVYDYFKVGGIDGEIPSFDADSVEAGFTRQGTPIKQTVITSGTAVRLYNYRLEKGYEDYEGPRRVFCEHLVDSVLPIRVVNARVRASENKDTNRASGLDARTFCGLEIHMSQALKGDKSPNRDGEEASGENGARVIDVGDAGDDKEFGTVRIRAYNTVEEITKSGSSPVKASGHGFIRSTNRVFFAVNGQVQHREGRGFLAAVGLAALKDHLAIVIDCSNLKPRTHQTIWKADRQEMLKKKESAVLEGMIKERIMACEALRELNSEIQNKSLSKMIDTSAQEVFEKIAMRDPSFARMMVNGSPFAAAARLQREMEKPNAPDPVSEIDEEYVGKFSPTFFEMGGLKAESYRLQRGKSMTVQTKTDVANDYFIRNKSQGKIAITGGLGDANITTARESLRNGNLAVTFKADPKSPLGEVPVIVTIRDSTMGRQQSLKLEFKIVVVEAVEARPATERKKREKPNKQLQLTMPNTRWMTLDGRPVELEGYFEEALAMKEGYDERDGAFVLADAETGTALRLNFDNVHLQDRLTNTAPGLRRTVFEKYKIAMQLSCLATEQQVNHIKGTQPDVSEDEIDRLRRNAAAVAASTALTLVDTLPKVMAKTDAAAAAAIED